MKVVKNKVAPPFKEAEFDILYGQGISRDGEIVDAAAKLDIFQKSGSWYSYNGERLGQGRDKVKAYLKEHPDFADEISKLIMEKREALLAGMKAPKKGAASEGEEAREAAAPPEEEEAPPAPARKAKSIDIEVDDE